MATITCPSCQRALRVPDGMLGGLVRCPLCTDTFPAPSPASSAAPADERTRPATTDLRTGRRVETEWRAAVNTPVVQVGPKWSAAKCLATAGGVAALACLLLLASGVRSRLRTTPTPATTRPLPPPPIVEPNPPAPPLDPADANPPRRDLLPVPPTRLPGLLAYWSFDEAGGDRAADHSGRARPGTLHNVTRVPGVSGQALRFGGPGSYFDYSDSPGLNFPARAPFTLSAWVRTRAAEGTLVSQRRRRDGSTNLDVTLEGGTLAVVVRQDGDEFGHPASVSGGAVNDGQWHHFALTRDPDGTIALFLDGRLCGKQRSAHSAGALPSDLRSLGCERYWDSNQLRGERTYFRGDLDEFCIFGRELSAGEVRSLAGRAPVAGGEPGA